MTAHISESVYRRHVLRAISNNADHFTYDRVYVKAGVMKPEESLFFQDLLNLASMQRTIRDEDDYFLCTVDYLYASLRWDHKKQHRYLAKLIKNGFIKTKKKGMPASRWIWINIAKVEQLIDDWLDAQLSPVQMQS